MAFCQYCGSSLGDSVVNFCPNCGAAISTPTANANTNTNANTYTYQTQTYTDSASQQTSDTAKTILTAAGTAAVWAAVPADNKQKNRRRILTKCKKTVSCFILHENFVNAVPSTLIPHSELITHSQCPALR